MILFHPVPSHAIEPRLAAGSQRAYRADGVTRRLVYSLALVPIVPAASVAGIVILEETPWSGGDGLRYSQFAFSALVVLATILIWRKAVVWTLGRRWLTAMVSLIPFVQVAVNLPLWTIQVQGCFNLDFGTEVLRTGQHQLGVGVWAWFLIWVWWGWEKVNMSGTNERIVAGIRAFPTAKRLAAAIGMIPFLVGTLFIASEAARRVLPQSPTGGDSPIAGSLAFGVMLIAALAVWILIWRYVVDWSHSAWRRTLKAWAILVGLPWFALFVFSATSIPVADALAACATLVGWGLWMAWTIRIWPMKPEALAVDPMGPRCMKCAYSLRGLRATRCPECGDEPTLDELWVGALSP